ncbi:MAG TPA: hypothetical protein VGG44_04440 [Tepidisphaeraceae bacterium]|jgi:hypothetical protein
MPKLPWGRTFETCINQKKDAVLIAGYPVFLRSEWGFQAFLIPPLTADDIISMTNEIMPPPSERWEFAGGYMFDVRYGEEYRLRISVVGNRESPSILLTRLSSQAAGLPLTEMEKWTASEQPLSFEILLEWCMESGRRDAILVPKCPPLVWSDSAIHVFFGPALTVAEVSSITNRIKALGGFQEGTSYPRFGFSFRTQRFCAAVFGDREPVFIALQKLPTDTTTPQG